MGMYGDWLRRRIATSLVLLLGMPFGGSIAAAAQQADTGVQSGSASSPQVTPAPAPVNQPEDTSVSQPAPDASDRSTQAPAGTAVAPYERGIGIAASRPAGAVIAPSKQRRNRQFLIRVGLLMGAAAAVGTVVALSNASPSTPR